MFNSVEALQGPSDLSAHDESPVHVQSRTASLTLTSNEDMFLNPGVTENQAYVDSLLVKEASLVDNLDRTEHARKQRIIGRVISELSMRSLEPTLNAQVDFFLRQLVPLAQQGEVVDVSPLMLRLAADVICHLDFGYPLGTLTEETRRPLLDGFGMVPKYSRAANLWQGGATTSGLVSGALFYISRVRRCIAGLPLKSARFASGLEIRSGPGMGMGRERKGEYQVWDVITAEHHGPNWIFKPHGDHWKDLVQESSGTE